MRVKLPERKRPAEEVVEVLRGDLESNLESVQLMQRYYDQRKSEAERYIRGQ
jgi:hypothetical protein